MVIIFFSLVACNQKSTQPHDESSQKYKWYGHEVVVSAYNSVSWQTQGDPNIAAWGDTLKPGMKSIAVSRDLLRMGLTHNTMVKIDTFPDTFYVKDKMNKRWKNRIDLYMGVDIKKAREWGRKKMLICYAIPIDSSSTTNVK
nr:hypothetical protein [uncultured Allomuricauda sp.]